MPNVLSRPKCDICEARSPRSRCDRRHPCIWCYRNGVDCTYKGVLPMQYEAGGESSDELEPGSPHSPIASTMRSESPGATDVAPSRTGTPVKQPRPRANSAPASPDPRPPMFAAYRLRGGAEEQDGEEGQEGHGPPGDDEEQAAMTLEEQVKFLVSQQASLQKTVDNLVSIITAKRPREDDDARPSRRDGARAKYRHRPDIAGDTLAPAKDECIPHAVWQVFDQGWKKHVPFTMLTNKYCQSDEATRELEEKVVMGLDGSLTATTHLRTPATAPDEIDMAEWWQANGRFLALLKEFFPENLEVWEAHIDFIMNHPRREKSWKVLMRYDDELRRRATRGPVNPGKWQHLVFDDLESDFLKEQVTQMAQKTLLAHTQHIAGPSNTGQRPFRTHPKHPPSQAVVDASPAPPRYNKQDSKCFRPSSTATQLSSKAPSRKDGESTAPPFAGDSIAPTGALVSALTPPIFARSANPPLMGLSHARFEAAAVSTLLVPDAWESMLRRLGLWDRFSDVPDGLRHGFRIGVPHAILSTTVPNNHKSALDRPSVIKDHIYSELNTGRYAGPFDLQTLEQAIGPFRCAPLGVVDKPSAPGKFRVIQDFSFPHGVPHNSLNSWINTDDFPCSWGFFHDVAALVSTAPPGALGATGDVDSAYRQIPVRPIDRPHIVVHWNGHFFIDRRVPFGAASSNGLFARCGDAMALIYERLNFGFIFKWVDDFLFIQFPPGSSAHGCDSLIFGSMEPIYAIAKELVWPWKTSKTKPFALCFGYLGFTWDLKHKTVSIPESKRTKYSSRITAWLNNGSASLKETEVLVGSLMHCTLAIPIGRPRLRAMIAFLASFPHSPSLPFLRKPLAPDACLEADWWLSTLAQPDCGSILYPPPPKSSRRVMSDASTSFGIGLVIDDSWWSWRLLGGWKAEGRDIGWAEAIGLELAVTGAIALGERNTTLTCLCDNQGVTQAWNCGRSRNAQQNASILRIMDLAADAGLRVNVTYVRSADNLADAPSRGFPPTPGLMRSPIHLPIPVEARHLLAEAFLG